MRLGAETRRRAIYALQVLAIAAAYYVVGEIALRIHKLAGVYSLIWAPPGIGFALVLLYGVRWWPGLALGAFTSVLTRNPPVVAVIVATTEVLEALAGYYLLRRLLRFRPQLERVRDVAAFAAVDATISFADAALGAGALIVTGFNGHADFVTLWSTWWWINLSGDLIVCPVLFTWARPTSLPKLGDGKWRELETIAFIGVGLLIVGLILAGWLPSWLPASRAPYYLLPLLLWAGVRFGPRGAATASFVVSLSAIVGAAVGIAPFAARADLQVFVAVSSVTTLMLSALAQERVHAVERTAAIQHTSLDAIFSIDADGRILDVNPAAEQLFSIRKADVLGNDLATVVIPPRLRAAYYQGLQKFRHEGTGPVIGSRYRTVGWRAHDAREFPVEVAVTVASRGDEPIVTGFVRDISAEQAAEAARREAREHLERTVATRTAELQSSLQAKDLLLRELHHRVKNNLQVMSSLLNLQIVGESNDAMRRRLIDNQNRIQSIALVHQLLYQSIEVAQVDFGDYLEKLVERIADAYGDVTERIATEVEAQHVQLDIDRAILCGMLVNELVTNSFAHAFPEQRRGTIRVHFEQQHASLVITVADDGIGMTALTDAAAPKTFGLRIVTTLAKQLDGEIEQLPGPGTLLSIRFPAATTSP